MGKNKLQKKQIGRIVGWSSIGILGLLGLVTLCPLAPAETKAVDCTHGDSNPLCTTAYANSQAVGVQVATSISISMQNKAEVDVVPKANRNAVSTTESTVSVATNNSEGYKLYMQAEQLTDGEAKLTSNIVDNAATINPVQGSVTQSEWETNKAYANTWGYSTDGTSYQAVPASTMEIKQVNTTAYNDQHTIDFGVAIDTSLPAGYYSNSIIVSAVANPMTAPLDKLTYMQEMETINCQKTVVGTTKQLIDLRDNKSYWVSKMADGNCWMNQNLALDLDENTPLTPALSDVSEEWVPTTTETEVPAKEDNPSQTTTRSWNLGEYVLVTPQKGVNCGSVTTGETITQCRDLQLVDKTWAYAPAYQGTWDDYPTTGMALIAVNMADKTYDSHYLIGNYYQWNAATAESGGSITSGQAASSICPKGWHLPTSGRTAAGVPIGNDDSFVKLLAAYGYPQPDQSTGWTLTDSNGHASITTAGATRLDGAPMYFVRSGRIDLRNGSLRYVDIYGNMWSSIAYSSSRVYALFLSNTTVSPSGLDYWYLGLPIRCVAL